MILAGDVGGTSTRLAVFEEELGTPPVPLASKVYPSREFDGLSEILREFLAGLPGARPRAAAFGVAGPVRGDTVETTNLPWSVDREELRPMLGGAPVVLVNDLVANATGIASLPREDFVVLQEGEKDENGNAALLSVGTGLGEAALIRAQERWIPSPSEGGHADLAPRDELEIELLRFLMRDLDHVSYERVLSGAGLYRVFQFVVERAGAVEPEWVREVKERGDRPQDEISRAAAENRCALSQEAVGLFVRVFGAEAGNLALRFLATGGVFLGGGVAPKMLGALQGQGFLEAFRAKGRMRPLLEAVPVMVIRNEFTALFGAARFASEAGRGG